PGYVDVNAHKWNDTGLVVKTGDKLDIRVLPGVIVWRKGLLLSDVAPPQGDRSTTPWNTPLWIDPQIPINVAPVGALIGMTLDPQTKGMPIEKPDGAKYFPILGGGRFTMTSDGKLFLGVNDGA